MRVRIGLCALVLTALAVSGASAQEAPGAGESAKGPQGLVAKLRERGHRVTSLGQVGGLSGWLVQVGISDPYALYVGESGYAVAGLMYGPDGSLLTGEQVATAGEGALSVQGMAVRTRSARAGAAAPGKGGAEENADGAGFTVLATRGADAKPAPAGLFAKSAAAFGFTLGHRGRSVVILADPGCSWSKEAVRSLGQEALRGRFRLRVIPVGVLARSVPEAVRIASAVDPALAWFGRETAAADRAGAAWIEENNAVFDLWGENAVPLIAWPAREGGHVYRVGVFPDVAGWVAEAFGP